MNAPVEFSRQTASSGSHDQVISIFCLSTSHISVENILVWSQFILRHAHGKAETKKRKNSLVENQEETRSEKKEKEEKLPARKEKKPRGWMIM